uniref:Uncharacterized protein n=1 Tax=Lygus hesperus TaxID=30085 RepID=A0A146MFT7_LYGHE
MEENEDDEEERIKSCSITKTKSQDDRLTQSAEYMRQAANNVTIPPALASSLITNSTMTNTPPTTTAKTATTNNTNVVRGSPTKMSVKSGNGICMVFADEYTLRVSFPSTLQEVINRIGV